MTQDIELAVPGSSFRDLGLQPFLISAIEKSGYTQPTPIQSQAIPILLEGRDLLGQAQTGSGKTAAFALPLLQRLDVKSPATQVLVLTPTRELAIQVAEAFEKYASGLTGLRVAAIYGGQDYMVQFRKLDHGSHVVVGTPGRVMDHMRRGSLNLSALRSLVLDEADEMLRMGFAEDVQWVLSETPKERHIALFSATLPQPIREIAQQYLRNPHEITIGQRVATADTVHQRYVIANPAHKESVLARILEAESVDGMIVFVKMKSSTEPLAEFLNHAGYRAAALNGDMPQKQRERIVDHLRMGKLDILVATDVAARGLDVQRISHVVNYDLPFDSEAYIHRIGRTGRAGRSGQAILFLGPRDLGKLKRIERATRQTIVPMEFPSNRVINKGRVKKFHDRIASGLAHADLDTFLSVVEQFRRDNPEIPTENIAAALAAIVHGKKPLLLKEEFVTAEFDSSPRDTRSRRDSSQSRRTSRFTAEDQAGRRPRRAQSSATGSSDVGLTAYRIQVGHMHRVKPGNIVGALANEAGIPTEQIGRIQIFEDHSTIDLPEGLSKSVLNSLAGIRVAGQPMCIEPADHRATGAHRARPPKPFSKESRPRETRPARKTREKAVLK